MGKLFDNTKVKELSYYSFYIDDTGKGIGLDSGDRLYYVLSIALVCAWDAS